MKKNPKSALSIRTGASSRRKVILVVGCGVVLQSKLNDWIADHD
jgi:anthranilate/para-aminobenzoate synthase component I